MCLNYVIIACDCEQGLHGAFKEALTSIITESLAEQKQKPLKDIDVVHTEMQEVEFNLMMYYPAVKSLTR